VFAERPVHCGVADHYRAFERHGIDAFGHPAGERVRRDGRLPSAGVCERPRQVFSESDDIVAYLAATYG